MFRFTIRDVLWLTVVIGIVPANLALDVGLFYTNLSQGFMGTMFLVPFGTVLSQILLLAVWFTCMEGSLGWRFGVPAVVTALIGYAAAIGVGFDGMARAGFPLIFQFPFFALATVLWPICRTRGWRLTADSSKAAGQRGQFRIVDVLAWMTIIGVLLALVRFLFTGSGFRGLEIWVLLAFMVLPAPVLWMVLLASFSFWPGRGWQLAAQGCALLIYSAIAAVICCRSFYEMHVTVTGSPGRVVLPQSMALTALFFIGVPAILALNCLALRGLGWRLVRPT
jgi:hypothetical protein